MDTADIYDLGIDHSSRIRDSNLKFVKNSLHYFGAMFTTTTGAFCKKTQRNHSKSEAEDENDG